MKTNTLANLPDSEFCAGGSIDTAVRIAGGRGTETVGHYRDLETAANAARKTQMERNPA